MDGQRDLFFLVISGFVLVSREGSVCMCVWWWCSSLCVLCGCLCSLHLSLISPFTPSQPSQPSQPSTTLPLPHRAVLPEAGAVVLREVPPGGAHREVLRPPGRVDKVPPVERRGRPAHQQREGDEEEEKQGRRRARPEERRPRWRPPLPLLLPLSLLLLLMI